jgi:hypothetical protein
MQKALKHLILYKIQQQQLTKNKKQKQKQKTNKQQLDTVCLHLVTLLFIYKNCIYTLPLPIYWLIP